jgi:hypothetical protein
VIRIHLRLIMGSGTLLSTRLCMRLLYPICETGGKR